ncbi:MAG: sodium:calcium antiporter [Pseudomonadota bacterium]
MLSTWLQFAVCIALIGFAGYNLSRYGDVIVDKTGLSATWIGMILLATVTSLPELATGISAVTVADVPNIAVGNALGSCVFNLLAIMILDFLHREESIYTRASQGHILSAGFGVILIGFVGFSLLLDEKAVALSLGRVGIYTPVIVLLYAIAIRTVFRYEQQQMKAYAERVAARYPAITLRQAIFRYAMAALIVIGAGTWLPFVGTEMAAAMGWNKTFVGTLFVAFATTIPELAVTLSALRIGALDMAIGNLLGSNLFDILIIAIDDLFFFRGPILSHVSQQHALSALSATLMTGVVIVGLFYRPATRVLKTIGWTSLFLFSMYLFNSYVLYLYGE